MPGYNKKTQSMVTPQGTKQRMEYGQGFSPTTTDATIPGRHPGGNKGGYRSQGETAGVGSLSAAVLNARPNISDPRNMGPSYDSSMVGSSVIPIVTMSSRNSAILSGGN